MALLIAGFGLAGMCAAIEAHDLDPSLSILILEKSNEAETGGNSRVAGQSLLISKNAEVLAEYQRKMSVANPIPEDMLVPWSEAMVALEPWIEERAAQAGARRVFQAGAVHRHPARVIAPVLQALQTLHQHGNDVARRDGADDATHTHYSYKNQRWRMVVL